jgi:SAM-dependent methyltransferase
MRAQAPAHPAVTYAAGSATTIPLPDDSCDAAVLFFVWHHVDDRAAAVRELHRVVKPGGRLFVQVNFSDRMPDTWWFRINPSWLEADRSQFPSRQEVVDDFAAGGWALAAREEVTWLRSASLAEDADRLRLRSVSMFELMSDEVVEEGFARIEAALPALDGGPQHETNELLVFEK